MPKVATRAFIRGVSLCSRFSWRDGRLTGQDVVPRPRRPGHHSVEGVLRYRPRPTVMEHARVQSFPAMLNEGRG